MKVRLLLASLFILSACSGEHDDLNSWMQQTRQEAKSKIRPPEPVAPVERVTYFPPQFSGPNAYSVQRMKAAYQNSNAPDLNRPKELLENYSLENILAEFLESRLIKSILSRSSRIHLVIG